jgi:hypothetical protein
MPIETTNEMESKDFKNESDMQSLTFLKITKNDENWALTSILSFIEYLKNKQQRGQITAGTVFLTMVHVPSFVCLLLNKG